MKPVNAPIRRYVDVRAHPTVVRLHDLEQADSYWLSESFVLTQDVKSHLQALNHVLNLKTGAGVFLIGPYGSGKSHFLAYLTQQLKAGKFIAQPPSVIPVSLVNFSATNRLEDIIADAVDINDRGGDRRPAWEQMLARHAPGLVLVVDELSEFLRAKPDNHAFSEDVRFLQFLGEWIQDKPCWVIAAMQEGIEHTGELEYSLYRKIKDRYPLRLLLTPAHIRSLIADSILVKQPGYADALELLCQDLTGLYPSSSLDFDTLRSVYPLHPVTLELMEEVRDRFSQSRGVVDFTVAQLQGDTSRGIEPFLDQPWGALLTPDAIVDHFRDLLDIQPEFLPLAQQLFPWYEKHLEELFDKPGLRNLAAKILRLLILVYLSPARETLSASEAATWLLFSATRLDPQRNRKIIERVLTSLAEHGRYVSSTRGRFKLELRDDSRGDLERLLARQVAALKGQDILVLETLVPLLQSARFNPFRLPRDAWQHRHVLWHFHERRYAVWLGEQTPSPLEGLGLCLRLPWGEASAVAGSYTVQPAPIEVTDELIELAALIQLAEKPHRPELNKHIQQRIEAHRQYFHQTFYTAWQDAKVLTPEGKAEPAPRPQAKATLDSWLEGLALWLLRRTYPAFERFAPGHGPLPKEAWLRFMRFALNEDLGATQADDYVKLIREAYLVPMGLLRHKGREYQTITNLDKHELIRLVTPTLDHTPSPKTVHEHLSQPIYGLVPDQINLLLVFLLLQGEIDILKERKSYREIFESLPNPLHYDRITPGHALGMDQINALERLCGALNIRTPAPWSVLTQRRCATQLRQAGRRQIERLQSLLTPLKGIKQGERLAQRIQHHIDNWNALDKGEHALQGLEQFLFEIGSIGAFLDEVATFQSIPEQMARLLSEIQRYLHLLQHPAVRAHAAEAETIVFDDVPDFEQIPEVETWLQRAKQYYEDYQHIYRRHHDRWWKDIAEHEIWLWCPPPLGRSRHLGLQELITKIEACRQEAAKQRCRGLVNLDYQPQCHCGFDGSAAPIVAVLERFDSLRAAIETQMRLFFQQDEIKHRLRDWQREGVEFNQETLSYLEGKRAVPKVKDVDSFDQYLGSIDLATEIDTGKILELLQQRLWVPDDLLAALERLISAHRGKRLRFTGQERQRELPADILAWCAEQSLRFGVALPTGLQRSEQTQITEALRPEWIGSPQALEHLESLGIDEAGVERVLGWLIEGHVSLPRYNWPEDSLLRIVEDLLDPKPVDSPRQLALVSNRCYRLHHRLVRVARTRWLDHLDALANTAFSEPPPLMEQLKSHRHSQWLIIDCLGLPMLETAEAILRKVFAEWRPRAPEFATLSMTTSTEAFYRELIDSDMVRAFEKINVIDDLIHQNFTPFDELLALATPQLEIACRHQRSRLDPAQPLLIFADHGFRIAKNGLSYTHGGASTLERVVPLWLFEPL
jgi:Family of unknown function (DUF6079)